MRYTVVWTKAALGHLANVYLQAVDKQAVTKAVDRIDLALKDDPELKSQPFGRFFMYEILLSLFCSRLSPVTEWCEY
jgi:hypothetical protein